MIVDDLWRIYLVGGIPTPLKNMSSSAGMMTFPTEWKNKSHVWNHQAVVVFIDVDSYIPIENIPNVNQFWWDLIQPAAGASPCEDAICL